MAAAPPDRGAEPSGSQLALEVAPATASQEAGIQAQVDAIRSRVMKMDNFQIETAYEEAANHPKFQTFTEEEGINPVEFGRIDEIEELVHFHSWLIEDGPPADLQTSPVDAAAAGGVPAKTENAPIQSEVRTTQADLVPPQPSQPEVHRNPVDSTVETALKRLQTVDLQDGQRPPQFLSSMGNVEVPCQTLVWMMVGGVKSPVPLPLSPEQCVGAGLELVNPPHQQQGDQQSTVATAPSTAVQSSGEARQAEGEGNASSEPPQEPDEKQMLRNLYMRFGRSQKRADLPKEIAEKFAALKEKEKKFGTLAPAVRKERQRLFEEFVQAGENWAESSIVLNNKNTQRETQRGIYKLFSKEDLLVKYHQNSTLVDELVKNKEELKEFELHPEVPGMKLYKCWDSSAVINDDESARSMTATQEGAMSSSQAAVAMQSHPSGSHGPADRESVPDPKKRPRKPKGGNDDGPAPPGTPTPGTSSVPKAKTASQEAKTAMANASGHILEGEGWNQKLLESNVTEQLRIAVVTDLAKVVSELKTARQQVEATVAKGASEDILQGSTQDLAKAIANYKNASKSAKSLISKPKSKAAAKAKAVAAP